MEQEEIWIPSKQFTSSFCRICVSLNEVDFHIYDAIYGNDGTISLHMMLGKLCFPAFNDEQMKSDETMNWPTMICRDCKCKVLEAYELFVLCVSSSDRLRKMLTEECVATLDHSRESETDGLFITSDLKRKNTEKVSEKISALQNPRRDTQTIIDGRLIKAEEVTGMSLTMQEAPRRTRSSLQLGKDSIPKHVMDGVTVDNIAALIKATTDDFPSPNNDSIAEKEKQKGLQPSENANSNSAKKQSSKPRRKKTNSLGEKTTKKSEMSQGTDDEKLDKSKTKVELYRCQLCEGSTYASPSDLTGHLEKVHPDQIRSCEQCPKVFMSEQSYQHHQYCHATGRSHFCIFCDKGFQKRNLLESHTRTHMKSSDFLCSLCGKEFANHTYLRQHTKIKHSGEKPWACTLCPSRFTTKGSLKMHQYTHSKIKQFSCETCGTQFTKHSSLVKHRLIHTGERPFVCEVCKMRFVSNYMLKRHMLTHTGEKPFRCTYCDRSFAQTNDMVKHIRTHVGDNLYKCDRCDASYRLLSELRNHYTEHYQSRDSAIGSSSFEENKNIRFTTTYIMNLRLEKEKAENSEVSEFSAML